MNREEAILRELNLHPLWKLRVQPEVAPAQDVPLPEAVVQPATQTAEPAISSSPSGETTNHLTKPASGQVAGYPASERGDHGSAGEGEVHASEKSRDQVIAELEWPELKSMVRDCTACKLRAGCTQTVFGVGDEQADWLFVGEGPGADEDALGEPFVGQAGKLLDNMLLAIGLKRGDKVYIANIVKCRPPGNRTPEADEIATCLPYLRRQIALIQPKIIVALGKTAASALLQTGEAPLGSLRGKLHQFDGIPLVATYHPAYLLRTPLDKAKAWQDLRLAVQTRNG